MSDTAVLTLRLPKGVKRGLERLAARFGYKPAQVDARLIEEGLRRRQFPEIDLRETAAGCLAYLRGTRFAIYWIAGMVPHRMSAEAFARQYGVAAPRIHAPSLTRRRSLKKSNLTRQSLPRTRNGSKPPMPPRAACRLESARPVPPDPLVKLLLDVHVAKATVDALHRLAPHIEAEHLARWRGGALLHAADEESCSRAGRKNAFFSFRT